MLSLISIKYSRKIIFIDNLILTMPRIFMNYLFSDLYFLALIFCEINGNDELVLHKSIRSSHKSAVYKFLGRYEDVRSGPTRQLHTSDSLIQWTYMF